MPQPVQTAITVHQTKHSRAAAAQTPPSHQSQLSSCAKTHLNIRFQLSILPFFLRCLALIQPICSRCCCCVSSTRCCRTNF